MSFLDRLFNRKAPVMAQPLNTDGMTLNEAQFRFSRMFAALLQFAFERGYEVTMGDGFRDPRLFGSMGVERGYGEANSAHKQRLAHDINLFKDGKYLDKTEDHQELGEQWEAMGGTWGGRFRTSGDGNHYSLKYKGVA